MSESASALIYRKKYAKLGFYSRFIKRETFWSFGFQRFFGSLAIFNFFVYFPCYLYARYQVGLEDFLNLLHIPISFSILGILLGILGLILDKRKEFALKALFMWIFALLGSIPLLVVEPILRLFFVYSKRKVLLFFELLFRLV